MKYRLAVRDSAEQDMNQAYDAYEAEQEGLGDRFHDEVAETLRKIEENPRLYPLTTFANYHKAALRIFPFCIYYGLFARKVVVVAVHDARRDPRRWQARIK